MVTLAGHDPAAYGLGNRRSIHLSYRVLRLCASWQVDEYFILTTATLGDKPPKLPACLHLILKPQLYRLLSADPELAELAQNPKRIQLSKIRPGLGQTSDLG